ncbi:DUF6796 family protein [Herbaspirillum chlorophenolicum]|uniref:DUF6796 family protein n=1 Tax=Herbaspirillum chlorophenolicum TaxID=211589 RepID=UPI00067D9C17|nr:DUF6796 family protein [Herbaspirillum chlorophenolicum]
MQERWIHWAGLCGIVASFFWIAGDMLIVGEHALPEDYPLLLIRHAQAIDFGGLSAMLSASEGRLAAGALVAALTSTLYLIGAWHLFRVARPAGRIAWAVFGLAVFGFANAPLAHAAFYFVGMLYKTILVVPEAAHPALLALGNQFHRVLLIAYLAAVGGFVLAFSLLAVLAGMGRTLWPRWMALVINPVSLAILGNGLPWLTPQPLRTWLGGAGISIATLILFGLSTWLVQRSAKRARVREAALA